jgi:hypothetical protein
VRKGTAKRARSNLSIGLELDGTSPRFTNALSSNQQALPLKTTARWLRHAPREMPFDGRACVNDGLLNRFRIGSSPIKFGAAGAVGSAGSATSRLARHDRAFLNAKCRAEQTSTTSHNAALATGALVTDHVSTATRKWRRGTDIVSGRIERPTDRTQHRCAEEHSQASS